MISADEVLELIRDYFETAHGMPRKSVMPATALEALDADSLDKIELILGLESQLDIKIPLGRDALPNTVAGVIALVMQNTSVSV